MDQTTSNRTFQALAFLVILSVVSVGSCLQWIAAGPKGQLMSEAWAVETGPLEKEVGQTVSFKAKVKNTGDTNSTYIITAMVKEHGCAECWETIGIADVTLSPGEYSEIFLLGIIECTNGMEGKYYDVRFVLYEAETEEVLDQNDIPEALHVKSMQFAGIISECWIE